MKIPSFLTKKIMYLLSEDRLGLSTKSLLFTVITSTTLSSVPFLTLFVLCDFVGFVNLALFAESASLLGYVNLKTGENQNMTMLTYGKPCEDTLRLGLVCRKKTPKEIVS